MDKNEYALNAMGRYEANEGSPDGIPRSESKGDQDNIDLAMFGKRPQLKVSLRACHVSLTCVWI